MLDDYDHQVVQKPKLTDNNSYQLSYTECCNLIDSMSFNGASNIFGKEKSKGALEGIIGSVYQTAFEEDIYPSNQEKAANLLYFIVKDHPFIDGCKRIAASILFETKYEKKTKRYYLCYNISGKIFKLSKIKR